MKKIFIMSVALIVGLSCVEAKDYVKTQVKEMKHAQKYATTKNVVNNRTQNFDITSVTPANIKDPHIMKFGDYKNIPAADYNAKLKQDEVKYKEYEKQMAKKHSKYYTTQADTEDFYIVYRVAEKLIRANKLDYMNWRICIKRNVDEPNAYSDGSNLVVLTTAMFDTFKNNEDALALVIGHEMGHALLGHHKRKTQLYGRMQREQALAKTGNVGAAVIYAGMKRKLIIDSKNMEYAADIEGAKLALHAGYSLNSGSDVLSFLTQFDLDSDYRSDHPRTDKRLESLKENSRLFPSEWKEMGKYNIYNSDVLPAALSSDRKSMVISAPKNKYNPNQYYAPETMNEIYARLGYMYYKNGEFVKSLEYFGELFKIDNTNAPAYLYASYSAEYLYKSTNNAKYLTLAKEYANKALSLDSKNKYMKEQVDNL